MFEKEKEIKVNTRSEQESKENLPVDEVKVPSSRFQDRQQVQNASSAERTTAGESSFNKEKVSKSGSSLKQEVASKVITNSFGGGIPGEMTGTYSLSYSGNEGTVLGSAAYTPSVGQSRSDSRIGKKLDATAKKINYVASEQIEQEFQESKPLAEAREEVQGYNGTYRNANARSQKNVGGVPADLMFQRSLDEIKRDQCYYTTGQHIKTTDVTEYDTPTTVPVKNPDTGVYSYDTEGNYSLNRGNYLHRELIIKYDSNGRLTTFKFNTSDLSTTVDPVTANKSSANATIDRNYAEMDRQIMDAKAGDEKADVWTPLARAVKEPTQTVAYLRDIENITGSEVFLAYKKTAACHSYQLNRSGKDGLKTYSPMVEACCGLIMPETSSQPSASIDPFDMSQFVSSGKMFAPASAIIKAFDSTTKYKTKADILTQPRSFKMHLQTADNNMNPLRVKADFVQSVNNREVFSTIDRDYDPLAPVCISDRAGLIHCYDFNDLYAFESLDSLGNPVFTKDPFKYLYSDLRNTYLVTAAIPLLEGIHKYLIANSAAFSKSDVFGTNEVHIPMIHSTCFFSFWSLLVLAATPFILNTRVNSLRDVLYFEKNFEYPFHQLISVKDANPMNAVNYENGDYQRPLETKTMMPSTRTTWVMPELFWLFDEEATDDRYSMVLPWYFNEEEFDMTETSAQYNANKAVMSMPSIRSGVRLAYLDDLYSMSERDVRLCLDRLTGLPEHVNGAGLHGVYKYGQTTDGIPFLTFGGSAFNIKNFCSLPRETGFFFVAPAGLLSVHPYGNSSMAIGNFGDFLTDDTAILGQTSYIYKFWHGKGAQAFDPEYPDNAILDPVTINVNRSTAYVQDWDAYFALLNNVAVAKDFGWVPAMNWLYSEGSTNEILGRSTFCPFTKGFLSGGSEPKYSGTKYQVASLQKAMWTRIQLIPMAISPFDFASSYRSAGEDAAKFDPYDFLYYFGLCGFRASDYREDVYNRSNEIVNKGFTFLSDPFTKDSPIFKESVQFTQSTNPNSLV